MKPIILSGHCRPIKDLKFSSNSEQLFSASCDRNVILWATETGQKLMTYQHTAAVNTIGVTSDSKLLVTGDNTGTSYIWEIQGGNLLKKMENEALLNLKSLAISNDDRKVAIVQSGRTKEASSFVDVYNLLDIFMKDSGTLRIDSFPPLIHIESNPGQKYIIPKFTKNDNRLYLSRDDGYIELIDIKDKITTLNQQKFHTGSIMDFDLSSNEDLILTASIDGTSNVADTEKFEVIKIFKPTNPTRNINACKFNPVMKFNSEEFYREKFHAVLSGGQDCRNVTTTNSKEGGFDLEFVNLITGESAASIKGHFGPVNSLAFSGNGKLLMSGSEDSTVRIQKVSNELFERKD